MAHEQMTCNKEVGASCLYIRSSSTQKIRILNIMIHVLVQYVTILMIMGKHIFPLHLYVTVHLQTETSFCYCERYMTTQHTIHYNNHGTTMTFKQQRRLIWQYLCFLTVPILNESLVTFFLCPRVPTSSQRKLYLLFECHNDVNINGFHNKVLDLIEPYDFDT